MGQTFIKSIVFIGMLSILYSCNEKKNETKQHINKLTILSNEQATSGWYNFPLRIELDSGNILIAKDEVKEAEYYTSNRNYTNYGQKVLLENHQLDKAKLSTNSEIMSSHLLNRQDVKEWEIPKIIDLKIGIPVFFKDPKNGELDKRIFFNRSKKIHNNLMSISLVVDPNDLFNYKTGIHTQGINKDINNPKKGNYSLRGKDWERAATTQIFSEQEQLLYESEVGIRIHGNLSRAQPQKSFTIIVKNRFNSKIAKLNLFGEEKRIHRMILRTPFTSSMQGQSILMDSYISKIALKLNLDAMGSTPCNLYLNGEYWGLYHLREKTDQYYLKEKYEITKKSITIIEIDLKTKDHYKTCYGEKSEWDSLISYLNMHDISESEHYNYISKKVAINNLIDYLIVSTFFANKDWPGNNFKFWKSEELDNKWRFIIHDMDACFRNDNMFKYLLKENQLSGNNISVSTLLFSELFKNKLFLNKFNERYLELKEGALEPNFLLKELNLLANNIAPSIVSQSERWHMPESEELWLKKIKKMRKYIKKRHSIYQKHLNELLKGQM